MPKREIVSMQVSQTSRQLLLGPPRRATGPARQGAGGGEFQTFTNLTEKAIN